ncbi:helix-turn-helix transcriptional regulator [Geobacter sp. DSM 9736]|uniref:ArsR/SmtB family transcription factor n=1 Tax=Geobacter sp. DSM 9736 TaxID=1277350 RepID=UPI000B50BC22|nr:metalloregulator ArsR/SmtB family transcription factor [Geobacter sp. DSM 9736]SNB47155.1 ArsR family transcriptional regulator [Geobacter sp. DSM 9736]
MDIETANEWAKAMKALAHQTRLQIVGELLKETKCVTDIQDIFPASQANISQHLTVLRKANLVDFVQEGSQRCYYLCRPRLVKEIIALLGENEAVARKSKKDIDREKQSTVVSCCVGK